MYYTNSTYDRVSGQENKNTMGETTQRQGRNESPNFTSGTGQNVLHTEKQFGEGKVLQQPGVLHNDAATSIHIQQQKQSSRSGNYRKTSLLAWHGSPHHFDNFDDERIKGSESGNIHGHGHYVGLDKEGKAVGKYYAQYDFDESKEYAAYKNRISTELSEKHASDFEKVFIKTKGEKELFEEKIGELIEGTRADSKALRLKELQDWLKIPENDLPQERKNHQFNANKESGFEFIDWDKKFDDPLQIQLLDKYLKSNDIEDKFKKEIPNITEATGKDVYTTVSNSLREFKSYDEQDKKQSYILASESLREHGFDGIIYGAKEDVPNKENIVNAVFFRGSVLTKEQTVFFRKENTEVNLSEEHFQSIKQTISEVNTKHGNGKLAFVVKDHNELPDSITKDKNFDSNVQAVKQGNITYFVGSKIENSDKAKSVWVHEVGSHGGLDNIMGKDQRFVLMNEVWDSAKSHSKSNSLIKNTVDHIEKNYSKSKNHEKGEEFISYLAEKKVKLKDLDKDENTIWSKFKNKMNESINKFFKINKNHFSEKELTNIALIAVKSDKNKGIKLEDLSKEALNKQMLKAIYTNNSSYVKELSQMPGSINKEHLMLVNQMKSKKLEISPEIEKTIKNQMTNKRRLKI